MRPLQEEGLSWQLSTACFPTSGIQGQILPDGSYFILTDGLITRN